MGRHREFDPEQALDAALKLFWRKGYEGTSVSDLSVATGVAAPGLYAAFGNKQALFLKALDRYQAVHMGYVDDALAQPSARGLVERYLRRNVDALTGRQHPPGCLGLNGALACSDDAESIRRELIKRRVAGEAQMARRLARFESAGGLPPQTSAKDLARYVSTVSQGLAVHAKGGASREQLQRIVDLALRIWPESARTARA